MQNYLAELLRRSIELVSIVYDVSHLIYEAGNWSAWSENMWRVKILKYWNRAHYFVFFSDGVILL